MDHPAEQKPLRLFCAVALPPEVRARAAAHAASLRSSGEGEQARVSWEREEKLHVTLKFFGDVKPARLDSLERALARAAARSRAFASRLEGCGVFPTPARPHVLWLGVADDEGYFAALSRRLEDDCAAADFRRDPRPFHPHVTLARLRAINSAARTLAHKHLETHFEPAGFAVNELVLIRSELGSRGSTYTVVSRHELGTGLGVGG